MRELRARTGSADDLDVYTPQLDTADVARLSAVCGRLCQWLLAAEAQAHAHHCQLAAQQWQWPGLVTGHQLLQPLLDQQRHSQQQQQQHGEMEKEQVPVGCTADVLHGGGNSTAGDAGDAGSTGAAVQSPLTGADGGQQEGAMMGASTAVGLPVVPLPLLVTGVLASTGSMSAPALSVLHEGGIGLQGAVRVSENGGGMLEGCGWSDVDEDEEAEEAELTAFDDVLPGEHDSGQSP